MKRRDPLRNDLVIGMTLAEVFLLLLIVGWYGSRLESEAVGGKPGTPAEVLENELKKANQELEMAKRERDKLEDDRRNLQKNLDWLGERLGAAQPIRDIPSADAALRGYTTSLKRGKAVCESENVLAHVVADNDMIAVTVRKRFAVQDSEFDAGQTLSNGRDVERFLAAVKRYYADRRGNRECAFDFTLEWRTDRDYRVAKKRFDPYFYPAGDRQVQ